ncbi:hypothetical protein JHK84_039737 [Glycine max]|nr:hypothetical protein JHK86_039515 [Glycine max]KAG5121397.1 hypothetical protein JHK84_039737 [Glycine max]KAH1093883.1 hypothetical protein GYH30_039556 [Glycine max]
MALPCSASVPLTTLTSPLLFMFSVLFLCGGKGLEKKLIKILFTLLPWIGYSNWKTFRRMAYGSPLQITKMLNPILFGTLHTT